MQELPLDSLNTILFQRNIILFTTQTYSTKKESYYLKLINGFWYFLIQTTKIFFVKNHKLKFFRKGICSITNKQIMTDFYLKEIIDEAVNYKEKKQFMFFWKNNEIVAFDLENIIKKYSNQNNVYLYTPKNYKFSGISINSSEKQIEKFNQIISKLNQ